MIRTPLRPLARILEARQKGENPDAIERENKRIRHDRCATVAAACRRAFAGLGRSFSVRLCRGGGAMGVLAMPSRASPRSAMAVHFGAACRYR